MRRGRGSPLYGIGYSTRPDGYIRVWKPGHPMANKDGYALEHRYVLYEFGVEIPPGSHVHHHNGNRGDNRIENLVVRPAADHTRDHVRERGFVANQAGSWPLVEERTCETCGNPFRPWTRSSRFCSRVCSNRRRRDA